MYLSVKVPPMSSRRYRVNTEIDVSGTVTAFLFGGVVGYLLIYPALPGGLQRIEPSLFSLSVNSTVAPLIGGVALFVLVVLGLVALNWLFMWTED